MNPLNGTIAAVVKSNLMVSLLHTSGYYRSFLQRDTGQFVDRIANLRMDRPGGVSSLEIKGGDRTQRKIVHPQNGKTTREDSR
jgi:hypothetical protein